MEWTELLSQIMQVCVIPLLGTLTVFLIQWIKNKAKQVKAETDSEFLVTCLTVLENTIVNAVTATNQTYVEALKDQNAFTVEAQKEAFQKTYDAVMASLTEDVKNGLMTITNDLPAYIAEMIEAKVNEQKKEG